MWLASGALLVAFASYVALPLGLAWYLPQFAAQHGIRLEVGRVRVEPFRSRLSLSGVRVATSDDSSIEWSNVETRVDLAALAAGRLVLDRFRLSEVKLRAGDSGMDGIGVLPQMPVALPEEVSVGELVIEDIELATVSEVLGHPASADWVRISSLDRVFRPEGAEVEADLSIGEGRSSLRGRLNLDDTGWILNASEIVATDVPLDGLPTLLGLDGTWQGRIDGAGPVRLVYSPVNGAFSATTDGRWAIEALDLGLARVAISGARADWNGAAFMMFSGDAVDTLSVDGEVDLREFRVDVADALGVEASEIALKINVSQAPETRLSVDGDIPAARFKGKGGVFEALEAEATQIVSRVALTIADGFGIEVERLKTNAFDVKLPAGRSIDVEQIDLERIVFESGSNVVSAAAGTAERVNWGGFADPKSTGAASRLAFERIARQRNGTIRIGLSSAESVEDRKGDSVLRLRDMAFDSTTFAPDGAMAVDDARIAETWLASEASTLILERLSLEGLERNTGGTVGIASGRARVVDHAHTGKRTIVGTEFEIDGGRLSGQAWEANRIRFGVADIETDNASFTLRELALADAAGEIERAKARRAALGTLELGFGAHRVVAEDLSADSPDWRDGTGRAQAIEATSVTLDTARRQRWRSSGVRLTGVETAASGRASAGEASLESLVLSATDDSRTGAQQVVMDGLAFDGESAMRAESVTAERTYLRTSDGSGIDVAGLRADALEWNDETLAVEQGAAPLMIFTATPVRASFDTVAFTSARLGTGGVREFATLTSASGRGNVERVLEWTAGALALNGYHAPAGGEVAFDSLEARDVAVVGDGNTARLRADRAAARGTRIDASGEVVFASLEVDAVTTDDAHGQASASARALRANPLTIRESALEIGALSLSGVEGAIELSESNQWEFPALPVGTGDAQSPFRVRIHEASAAKSGSIIRILDRSTEPDFEEDIKIRSAALRAFDSAAIGVPARFAVEAAADAFAALQVDGVLVPTLTGTDFDLNATVRGLSLRDLSPYARLHLGRPVEDGHADVAFETTIRTSDLEGVANVTLSGVVLGDSEPPAGSPQLGTEGSSVLDAALDSLEDEQGRIELEVPLRGELDAPDFDFDGLLARALARAAVQTAEASPKAD